MEPTDYVVWPRRNGKNHFRATAGGRHPRWWHEIGTLDTSSTTPAITPAPGIAEPSHWPFVAHQVHTEMLAASMTISEPSSLDARKAVARKFGLSIPTATGINLYPDTERRAAMLADVALRIKRGELL